MPEHEPETWVENINRAAQFCSVYTMGPAVKERGNKKWNFDFTKVDIIDAEILRCQTLGAFGGEQKPFVQIFTLQQTTKFYLFPAGL